MKQTKHQETHPKTDETSSNNENKKKNTTMIKVSAKKLLRLKASAGKRTERHATGASSFQHSG
jgi:hypothetical protein